jgi:hypothetical protein
MGYQVVCVDDRYTKPPVIYRGSDASKHFLESLLQEEEYIREILDHIEPLHMTNEDEIAFQNSKQCFICGEEFSMISGKVRDHCHHNQMCIIRSKIMEINGCVGRIFIV